MNGALCVGQYSLFDSRRLEDHNEAKKLCKQCPAILECAALLHNIQKTATGGPAGGPQHRRHGETPCEPCLAARRKAQRDRYYARKQAAS